MSDEAKRQKAVQKLVDEWGHGVKDHPNFENMVKDAMVEKPKKIEVKAPKVPKKPDPFSKFGK